MTINAPPATCVVVPPAPASGEVLQGEEVTITIKSAEFDYPTVNEASKVTVKFELEGKDKDNYQIADIELDGEITPYIITDVAITGYYDNNKLHDGNSGVKMKNVNLVDGRYLFTVSSENYPDKNTDITFEIDPINYCDEDGFGVTKVGENYTFDIKVTPYSNTNYAFGNINGTFTDYGSILDNTIAADDIITAFKNKYTDLSKTYDGTTDFTGFDPKDDVLSVSLGTSANAPTADFKIT